jgi:hypothetical protein
MYLDLGLYGEPKAKDYHSKNTITALESYLGKIRGYVTYTYRNTMRYMKKLNKPYYYLLM